VAVDGGRIRRSLFWPVAFPVAFLVVSFVVVDYVPDQLLRPYVSGRTLHVGAVMLAYTLGPFLFGWYGIFLGPFVLVVLYEFARIVVPWLFGTANDDDDPERTGADEATAPPSNETTAPLADPGYGSPVPGRGEPSPDALGEPTRPGAVDAPRGPRGDGESQGD